MRALILSMDLDPCSNNLRDKPNCGQEDLITNKHLTNQSERDDVHISRKILKLILKVFNNHDKCFLNGDGDTNHESKESSEFVFKLKSLGLLATNIALEF